MKTQALNKLLSPLKLGSLSLKNRMVMAPMTRSRAGDGDEPTPLITEYYRQRASAGLIISEGSQISPQAKGYPRTPGIHSEAQVAGWKRVTEAVHAEGGLIYLQLWHVGRLSHPLIQAQGELPVAPSAIRPEGELYTPAGLKAYETPRALELDEIPGLVSDFARGAENAKLAGFDGVEIHGANGYLVDQFLRDGSNHRTDAYGGSLQKRARFLQEVVEATIGVFGAERVGVRLSPNLNIFSISDSNPKATFDYTAGMLAEYGLAYLHVVEIGEEPFDFAALKKRFGGVYIANGGYSAERAEQALRSGTADLVSFGTPFLANPDLVARTAAGIPWSGADKATFYQGEERGYTDYPVWAPAKE